MNGAPSGFITNGASYSPVSGPPASAIAFERIYCADCAVAASKDRMVEVARMGRVAEDSPEAEARRADTKRRHDVARQAWVASMQPAGLDKETYIQKIQPRLASVANSAIASALGVSLYYAADIRRGPELSPSEALAGVGGAGGKLARPRTGYLIENKQSSYSTLVPLSGPPSFH